MCSFSPGQCSFAFVSNCDFLTKTRAREERTGGQVLPLFFFFFSVSLCLALFLSCVPKVQTQKIELCHNQEDYYKSKTYSTGSPLFAQQ